MVFLSERMILDDSKANSQVHLMMNHSVWSPWRIITSSSLWLCYSVLVDDTFRLGLQLVEHKPNK